MYINIEIIALAVVLILALVLVAYRIKSLVVYAIRIYRKSNPSVTMPDKWFPLVDQDGNTTWYGLAGFSDPYTTEYAVKKIKELGYSVAINDELKKFYEKHRRELRHMKTITALGENCRNTASIGVLYQGWYSTVYEHTSNMLDTYTWKQWVYTLVRK